MHGAVPLQLVDALFSMRMERTTAEFDFRVNLSNLALVSRTW